MSIFSLFKAKKKSHYTFSDEDRELSVAKRKAKAQEIEREQEKKELKWQLEKEELLAKLDEYRGSSDDEEDGNDDIVSMIGSLVLASKQPQQTQVQPQQLEEWDDIQIQQTIDQLKEQFGKSKVAMFKKLPQNLQLLQIKQHFPMLSDNTIRRAVEILNEG